MKETLIKLRREKMELFGKIKKLESFRGSDEWNKLSTNHKQLLDIQLQAMTTYLETLIGRCLDLEESIERQKETEETTETEQKDEEPVVKIIVIKKD